MKKHLAVISFVIIFLLAIGTASAHDGSNFTDDSVISITGLDDNQLNIDELDEFNGESMVESQENILNQSYDSSEYEANGDGHASDVSIDDVTANEGEIVYIPFDVVNSDGTPVSGNVKVIISGEGHTISRQIQLDAASAQDTFTITDFIGLVNAKGGSVSDIYDIVFSSANFTDVNISKIISGLDEIDAGGAVDGESLADGIDRILKGTQLDAEKVIEGINYIVDGSDIDVSRFSAGFEEMIDGININDSAISKITDVLIAVIDGFNVNSAKLQNNILDSIIINKASFVNGLNSLLNDFNGDSSQGSVSDVISRLNLQYSPIIKIELGILMLKNEFTLLEVAKIFDEILSYNKLTKAEFLNRLSKATDGFSLDFSDIANGFSASSSGKQSFDEIVKSVRINENKLLNSIVDAIDSATFDKSKVANELAGITGFETSKLLKVLDGASDIYHGLGLNTTDVVYGIAGILKELQSGNSNALKVVLDSISFNGELFSNDFDKILSELNYTRADISDMVHNVISQNNMKVPKDLDANLSDSLNSDKMNFTQIGNVLLQIMKYNNITGIKLIDLFTDGSSMNLSKIIQRISGHDININKIFKIISTTMLYVKIDYNKIFTSAEANENFNSSGLVNALVGMFSAMNIDVSKIKTGINKIYSELESEKSNANNALNNIIHINPSKIHDGSQKAIDSISINEQRFYNGLAKIISAFDFKRSNVYNGLDEITKAINLNNPKMLSGISRIADGLGINATDMISKLFAKFGYVASFQNKLAPGKYDVTVEYTGSNDISAVKDTAKLTILSKMNTPIKFSAAVDEYHVTITGSVNPDAKGFVLLEIGDHDVYVLAVDGKIVYEDDFKPGSYSIKATYLGDLKFNKNSTVIPFIVKSKTQITVSEVNVVYGNSKNIAVTLNDENGKPLVSKEVTVNLNGKTYVRTTDANGQITVGVPNNLKPTTYTASVAFAGDSYNVKSEGSAKVVVSKATPKITAKPATFKSKVKTKKYTITLKNNKNKIMKNAKVTIKVNGKTYSDKTDSKGKATFKITKLTKKGSFNAVITYTGNSYYKKVTKKVNIKNK